MLRVALLLSDTLEDDHSVMYILLYIVVDFHIC